MLDILRVLGPVLMVAGALISLGANLAQHGDWPTSLQWLGAAVLYTALLFRNIH